MNRVATITACRNDLDLRLYRHAEWVAKRPLNRIEGEAHRNRLAELLRAERDGVQA